MPFKVALRWRTEAEVISGKGQFVCGCKTCSNREPLRSWEVNFGYVEQGERKNALIKLRKFILIQNVNTLLIKPINSLVIS